MAKTSRVSINAFENAVGNMDRVNPIEWNGLTIEVKERIGYADMVALIVKAAEASFSEDGAFCPEVTDFAMRLGIVALYTNLAIPADIEKRYKMVYASGVFDAIAEVIDPVQLETIRRSTHRRVEQRAQAAVEMVLKQAGEVNTAILELREKFEEQANALLGDMDPEEMKSIMRGLANGSIDEKKIVDAYMERKAASGERDAGDSDE